MYFLFSDLPNRLYETSDLPRHGEVDDEEGGNLSQSQEEEIGIFVAG